MLGNFPTVTGRGTQSGTRNGHDVTARLGARQNGHDVIAHSPFDCEHAIVNLG